MRSVLLPEMISSEEKEVEKGVLRFLKCLGLRKHENVWSAADKALSLSIISFKKMFLILKAKSALNPDYDSVLLPMK